MSTVLNGSKLHLEYEIQEELKCREKTASLLANLLAAASAIVESRDAHKDGLSKLGLTRCQHSDCPFCITVIPVPAKRLAKLCQHVLTSEPDGAELCLGCLTAKVAMLSATKPANVATMPRITRKPVPQQTTQAIAAANKCPHGFGFADCPICRNGKSIDVDF